MTHARIPDFSRPLPPRSNSARTGARRQAADGRFLNLPHETLPGTIEPWEAVAPIRPDTAHSAALRFLDATGEALTAVAIIAGGRVFAYRVSRRRDAAPLAGSRQPFNPVQREAGASPSTA